MTVVGEKLADQIVSRETMDRLREFETLVKRWTPAINLISKSSVLAIWDRHIVDSAQLFALCPAGATHWLDIGSGGGFPGLVIAILAKEVKPELKVTLVESDARKATFLRYAAAALSLTVDVKTDRVESLPGLQADVVSARALASLTDLLAYALHHLAPEGVALFPKGARHAEEAVVARQVWRFDLESKPSLSDPDAAILSIRNIERAKQD
ncbi:MAG: 16S rRNA (guanine(527)-N(7))-methyltransferase RsmG [Rhodobacterales bacterium]|nr:MAG: 16S rRNA (guanine(527)-N(7))-methyltransferase RsmG [Rhodobacterales bacterium]